MVTSVDNADEEVKGDINILSSGDSGHNDNQPSSSMITEETKESNNKSAPINNISVSKRLCLDQNTAQLLKKMYKE